MIRLLAPTKFAEACVIGVLLCSCGSDGTIGSSGEPAPWLFEGMGGSTPPSGGASSSAGTGSAAGSVSARPSGGGGSSAGSPASGGAGPASAPGSAGKASSGSGGSAISGGAGSAPTAGATSALYHQLPEFGGIAANNPNHHGRVYFLGNAHRDENGVECTSCHGTNYEGDAGPACASCHGEWRSSCSFCHGASDSKANPPRGIFDETSIATLAVGRHDAHLASGNSHGAFACSTCHTVPPANDVNHTLEYKASNDLSVPGHHGDVTLTGAGANMTWNVEAAAGMPISARGTCVGGCHSDGRGGMPLKSAYWAGGTWTNGCGNCHGDPPRTGHHRHALEEGGTCRDCHAGSTNTSYAADTHFNGKRDYLGNVVGQGMTLKPDSRCASGVSCNGPCHGEDEEHNNDCW